ncbi:MAG: helix-turn-helix domain-containing protein [Puniceicoccaceae bacterium]
MVEGLYFPRLCSTRSADLPLSLESCQHFNISPPHRLDSAAWGRRRYPAVVVTFTLGGSGTLQYDGKTHTLRAGDCFHIHLKEPHRYWMTPGQERWSFVSFTLQGPLCLELEDRLLSQFGPISQWPEDTPLLADMWTLYETVRSGSRLDPHALSSNCYTLCMRLLAGTGSPSQAGELPNAIRLALDYMDATFDEHPGTAELAEQAGLSPFHFTRLFKAYMGQTPGKYVEHLRIKLAKQLLENPQLPLNEIALRCGYNEPAYFSTVFKRCVGITPSRYRRNSWKG